MEIDNKLVTMVITLSVVIISVAAILMPVISSATETTDTYTNEGLYHLTKYGTSAELVITWDHTDPEVITAGTDTITLPQDSAYPLTLTGNNSFFARYSVESDGTYFQVFSSNNSVVLGGNTTDETDVTITISSGSITITNGTSTVTYTYDDFVLAISTDGPYVMKSSTDTAYVLGDSEIYGVGRSLLSFASGSRQTNFYIEGTISGGFTITPISRTDTTSIASYEVDSAAVDGHVDLYTFDSISFIATATDVDETASATYSQVIVPYEVTAEKSTHLDSGTIALLAAIPSLIIVSLIMVATGGISKRD